MFLKYCRLLSLFAFIVLSLSALKSQAQEEDYSALFASKTDFLKVDEAFILSTEIVDNEIIVKFDIADDYYMYRSRFNFTATGATLAEAYIPDGKKKVDEYLGNVEVYYNNIEISIPFTAQQKAFQLTVEYQGCAEAGLCYPPEEKQIELFADAITLDSPVINKSTKTETNARAISQSQVEEFVPEQEKVVNFLTDKSLVEIIFYFVMLGIALAFTPCVLPMVPILSSIIVGQGNQISHGKAFSLSLVYTQGMAIPYTILGIAIGALGGTLTNTLQQPLFIGITAFIFVLLALSMFGFYELQLPQKLQNKLNNFSNSQKGGSHIGAAIMGAISALVVSPCVTVPLAGVLLYIAQTGDQLIGGVALYSLAFGMGIPLLIVGVGGNKLLPKSGNWMNAVKAAFGVIMLAMALYISKHLIPGPIYLAAWAILLIVSAIYMGALSSVQSNVEKLFKGLGLVLFVYGIILILGAATGNGSLLKPLNNLALSANHNTISGMASDTASNFKVSSSIDVHAGFTKVKTIQDVEAVIAQAQAQGKTVMFDYFAESCTACYEFAEFTFPDPKVQQALKNTILIQADVTANDAEDKALMQHYDVKGLPSILFFNQQGVEATRFRAVGFESADIFSQRINAAFKSK
jgi:thioredoxin:protein disulfide reductase